MATETASAASADATHSLSSISPPIVDSNSEYLIPLTERSATSQASTSDSDNKISMPSDQFNQPEHGNSRQSAITEAPESPPLYLDGSSPYLIPVNSATQAHIMHTFDKQSTHRGRAEESGYVIDAKKKFTVRVNKRHYECKCDSLFLGNYTMSVRVGRDTKNCACRKQSTIDHHGLLEYVQGLRRLCSKVSHAILQPIISLKENETRVDPSHILEGYVNQNAKFETRTSIDKGVSLMRLQFLKYPEVHYMHKIGFKTVQAINIDNTILGFNIYTYVRIVHGKQRVGLCHIKDAALSIFFGKQHVGGILYPTNKLPSGRWISLTATGKRSNYSLEAQPITIQLSFTYHNDMQCLDALRMDVQHLIVCSKSNDNDVNENSLITVAESIAFSFQY